MQSVVLTEPGRLMLTDTPDPGPPPPGQALVRIHRVGICGTDLHAYRGRQTFFTYPRILGHELGVEVLVIGPTDSPMTVKVGDRCAVEPYLSCGQCIACRRGKTNCCVNMQVLGVHRDGGMRSTMHVPLSKLHPSTKLSLEELALVEMLTIGAHAVNRAQVEAGETVLVLGAGPIGLSVMQFAQGAGARVVALDMDAFRLDFAQAHLGVAATIAAGETALDAVRSLTDGDMPTVVFDATGAPASMNRALDYLANGGRLVFVGHHPGDVMFSDAEFHRRETTLLATRNATASDFRQVLDALESGRVDLAPWITHRAGLSETPDALPGWLRPEAHVVKAMLSVP